ncbi:MAG: sensor histidine kinase [Mycobacteriaceae bacterium]
MRALRGFLHLMLVALLALAVVRARVADAPPTRAVLVTAVVLAAVYAAGVALPVVRRSQGAAAVWLATVGLVWLVLLLYSREAVYLAFPLFFLQLHLLPPRWGIAAVAVSTVAAIIGFSWHQGGVAVGTVIGPTLGAAVAIAVVFGYQALYRESEQRRRLIDELTATRNDLAAAEHAAGVLSERERLAREIHDTLAQGLSSIQLLLRAAERMLPDRPDAALGHVQHARLTAVDNLEEARRFVRALTPPELETGSLPAALERLCAKTVESTGLAVECRVSGTPTELPTAHEVALLRIAQSALANAAQHADATRVGVTLSYMDTEVALDVVDDGAGFDPESVLPAGEAPDNRGFGLAAMCARARALQGTLAVESSVGGGTAVAVTLPLGAGA